MPKGVVTPENISRSHEGTLCHLDYNRRKHLVLGIFVVFLALLLVTRSPGHSENLELLCDGAVSDTIGIDIVYRGEGEIHLSWEFRSTADLWDYNVQRSGDLEKYDQWLQARKGEKHKSPTLSELEHRINAAVGQGRLGIIRPLNCLEATLLARQVRSTDPARMREFLAYVLRKDQPDMTKIYWLSGPGEFPPKSNKVQPLIIKDVQAGWRLYAIIHNHTGPAPVAAPGGSDVQYGLSWADNGAERFIVLGGFRAFDVSSTELRAFMRDGIDDN